jgi:hypothetical protein
MKLKSIFQSLGAGLGLVVGGHLGFLIGGFIGNWIGDETKAIAQKVVEKGGDKVSDTLARMVVDSIAEKMRGSRPSLESAYRKALSQSLERVRQDCALPCEEFNSWFDNWKSCLASDSPLRLDDLMPLFTVARDYELAFSKTLERLDAQGRQAGMKLLLLIPPDRSIPATLLTVIATNLPEAFKIYFDKIIVSADYKEPFKQIELDFQRDLLARFENSDLILNDVRKDVAKLVAEFSNLQEEILHQKPDIIQLKEDSILIKRRLEQILVLIAQMWLAVEPLVERQTPKDAPPQDVWWWLANIPNVIAGGAQGAMGSVAWAIGSIGGVVSGATQNLWNGINGTAQNANAALLEIQIALGMIPRPK